MIFYDIIIVGAGASGLMAAYAAAQKGISVCILEKMPRPGRKIMLTGKGRCNFTNEKEWGEFQHKIHPNSKFFRPAFYELPPQKLRELFAQYGLESVVERGQRVFPQSQRAADVVDCLEKMVLSQGVKIHCHQEVNSITHPEDGGYQIKCKDGKCYRCHTLILATGGLSYPSSGSSGDGYRFAKELGLKIKPTFPSLTALVPQHYKATSEKGHIDRSTPLAEMGAKLCGISLKNIGLQVWIDGTLAESEEGDLDFTDGGIEGPLGFRVSRKVVKALQNGARVLLEIDLKPKVDESKLNAQNLPLEKLLPYSVAQAFSATSPGKEALSYRLKHWKFPIVGYVGYERCVVTAGGVALEEISPKTYEAKASKGLFICGELLDLDADTGGYNLHIAFASGWAAGKAAASS